MLKDGTHAVVKKDSYPVPPIFAKLAKDGEIEEQMMYNTFNMGLGMILAVDPEDVENHGCDPCSRRCTICSRQDRRGRKRSDLMLRVVVMVSGGGTNLQAILDAVDAGRITNTEIVGVISNNKNAYALTRAKNMGSRQMYFAEGL